MSTKKLGGTPRTTPRKVESSKGAQQSAGKAKTDAAKTDAVKSDAAKVQATPETQAAKREQAAAEEAQRKDAKSVSSSSVANPPKAGLSSAAQAKMEATITSLKDPAQRQALANDPKAPAEQRELAQIADDQKFQKMSEDLGNAVKSGDKAGIEKAMNDVKVTFKRTTPTSRRARSRSRRR